MADHNDPNAVNSIFSDIDVSAADLYDIFGFPADDRTGVEKVVIALTFSAVPHTGVFDTDMLYRILIAPDRRIARSGGGDTSLAGLLTYIEGVKEKYLKILRPSEVRVTIDQNNRANLRFIGFPGGSFSASIGTNEIAGVRAPGGHQISVFVGGRDDAFFNDLTGFFRSINYAPQFYPLVGVAPYDDDSGVRRGQRHINGGPREIRDLLYMATLAAATRHNPVIKAFYQRLRGNGK